MKNIKSIGLITAALVALSGALSALAQTNASAANHTVSPGQSIQVALNAANSGDTIILSAGTYNERLEITKPVTLKGEGTVVINTKETTNINAADLSVYKTSETFKGVAIYDTSNVTLQNIIFDGENAGTGQTRQTGVDISGAKNTTLSNIVAKNYIKNGIAVVTQFDATRPTGNGVAFNNTTVDNAGWAGIAFYPKSNGDVGNPGVDRPLKGVTFSGTTTISNTAYGIQFGGATTVSSIEGVNGAPVALGTVIFTGNAATISQDKPSLAAITIAANSTINGTPVTGSHFTGLSVTIIFPETPPVTTPLTTATTDKPITLTTPAGTTVTASSTQLMNKSQPDSGYTYPLGLVDFSFTTNKKDNVVSLVFVTDLTPSQVVARKYNPTSHTYTSIKNASVSETILKGKHALKVSYTITDNGPLDLNPAVGAISDPVGLAQVPGTPNTGLAHENILPILAASLGGVALVVLGVTALRRTTR